MKWLLYMLVSAFVLEGLVFFVKGHSFYSRVVDGLVMAVEDDNIVVFILSLMVYVIAVACMPLVIFAL